MTFDTNVMDRIRSSYSLKMVVTLTIVFVITLVSTGFFYGNVSGELHQSANGAVTDHASDGANVTALWVDSNAALATGVASSGAVESGDTARIADRLDARATGDRVDAIHYVDRDTGEIRASSRDAAVGDRLDVDAPADGTGAAVGSPRERAGESGPTVPFVAAADEGHLVVVSASTDALGAHLADDRYATALVREGSVVASTGEPAWNGTAAAGLAAEGDGIATGTVGDEEFAATATAVPGTDWEVVTYAPTEVVYSDRNTATAGLVALLFVIALNLGVFGITIGGNLALALRQLAARAGEIGEGNLDVELATDRTDEVGMLYGEFAAMRDSLKESLAEAETAREAAESAREEAEQRELETQQLNEQLEAEAERYSEAMAACADGDLTQRLHPETDSRAMEAIADSFNEMLADLERTVADVQEFADDVATASRQVEESADEVGDASAEVSDSVDQISEGAQEQTQDLQATADEVNDLSATIEEVASTTNEVASQSDRVAELGADGRETAQETIEEMRAIEAQTSEVVDVIDRLTDEIEEINEVTRLIDEIAEQTAILALNANIEAARAGEAGSGFGVVAEEVKDLSAETQQAVEEIERTISTVQERAEDSADGIRTAESRITEGTESVEALTDSLEAIVDGVDRVNGGLVSINDATDEQADSAQEIVRMVDEITSVSEETTRQAETVADTSDEASESISEVSDAAAGLVARTTELQSTLAAFEIDARDGFAAGDGPSPTGVAADQDD